jgi:mono/diheme cytochrome c family protein
VVTPTYNSQVYPFAIPVAIIPSTFYQVAPELAVAAIVQAASDQAALKTKALGTADVEAAVKKALLELFQQTPGAQPKVPPIPPIPPAAGQVSAPTPGVNALLSAQKVVNAKCTQCHRPGDQFPDLTDLSKVDEKVRDRMVLRAMTDGDKKMPPKGPNISGEELEALHAFALSTK